MNYLTKQCNTCLVRKPYIYDPIIVGSYTKLMVILLYPNNKDLTSLIHLILSKLKLNESGYILTYLCRCGVNPNTNIEQLRQIYTNCKSNIYEEIKIYNPTNIILVGDTVASLLLPEISPSQSKYFNIPNQLQGINYFIIDDPLNLNKTSESVEGYINNIKWLIKEQLYIKNNTSLINTIHSKFNDIVYSIISSDKMLEVLKLKDYKLFCIDIETTGLVPYKHKITSIGILLQYNNNLSIYIIKSITLDLIKYIKQIFDDPTIIKLGHNLSFDLYFISYTYNIPFNLTTNVYDTMIMQYILRPDTNIGLKFLAQVYFGLPDYSGGYKDTLFNDINKYNARDVYITYSLYNRLYQEVKDLVEFDTHNFILQTLNNFLKVKLNGILIDLNEVEIQLNIYMNKIQSIENYFIEYMKSNGYNGERNINSLAFVRWLLYTNQNLPQENYTKNGNLSTDKTVLDKYKDNIEVNKLLEYRELNKVYTSYLLPYKNDLVYNNKVYPNYSLTGTVSGRTMCNNPNIQQVPKHLKHLYISHPNNIFLIFDYKSAEVYSLYYITRDKTLKSYLSSGFDFHTKWSETIFGKELAKEKRQLVKGSFVFASFYGAGYKTVASHLKIDFETAKSYQTKLLHEFKDVKQWQKDNKQFYDHHGYLTTLTNRKIYGSFNYQQSCNIPVQCLASDIALYAMNELCDLGYYCPLFIHDSIVVEVPEINHQQEFEKIKSLLTKIRFKFMDLPLKVESLISKTWR